MGTSIAVFSFLFLFCLIISGEACSQTQYSYHYTTAWQQYNANKKSKKSPPRDHWEVPDTMTSEFGKWITQYTENRTKMGKGKTHEEASAEGSDASIKVGPDGIIPGLDIPLVWQGDLLMASILCNVLLHNGQSSIALAYLGDLDFFYTTIK